MNRDPDLHTAFACEFIFSEPASSLFPRAFAKARRAVRSRIPSLVHRLSDEYPGLREERTFRHLRSLLDEDEFQPTLL